MRLLFSGLLCLALSLLLFLVSSCNHANLTGFTTLPKQTACIFKTEGSSKDSFPHLGPWPGWNSFQDAFQNNLVALPHGEVIFSPYCLRGDVQWLGIWEYDQAAPAKLIKESQSWEQSIFQQETIYFQENGHAVCAIGNLVLYASMPILIEDALRAMETPENGSAKDLLTIELDTWTLMPHKLREAGQSCWNLPFVDALLKSLPEGTWSGPIQPGSTLLWQGKELQSSTKNVKVDSFPFWGVLPVDLVWASFLSETSHPTRAFWQEPFPQFKFGPWFVQGTLESQPSGEEDLFVATQLEVDLDSLGLPGVPDPSLVPDFPMLATHRIEAQGDRPAYWAFQLEDILFLVPSKEQAYTLISRFINNQTLEVIGGQYQQACDQDIPQQLLYYRSGLDEGWYKHVWQKGLPATLSAIPFRGTHFFGQTADLDWHWIRLADRQGVPPKTDRTFYLQDTLMGDWTGVELNDNQYVVTWTVKNELLLYQNDLRLAWSRRFTDPIIDQPIVLQGEGEQVLLVGTHKEIFLFKEDGSLSPGYPLKRDEIQALIPTLGYPGAYWMQTKERIQSVEIRKDPLRPVWQEPLFSNRLSQPIRHYQTKDQDVITGILGQQTLFAWDLKGRQLFDSIPLETPALATPAFQDHPLSTRLITPMRDGRVKITSLSGAGFNVKMDLPGPMEHWAVGDLVGDKRLEYIGTAGPEVLMMGYTGKEWKSVFRWRCPGTIAAIEVHDLPGGALLSVLDRDQQRIWLLSAQGEVLEGFPVAGKGAPLVQKHPNQRGFRILTHLDKSVVSYQWSGF
ncbi:MAG: hypothetical protein AAGH79_07070 [Bacteroidota bacterium]